MSDADVASFYRFLDLDDPRSLGDRLRYHCEARRLLGTVLLAHEGVNGTLAGRRGDIEQVIAWLERALKLDDPVDARWTRASAPPFRRLRVRLRKEIVTLGRPDIRPDRRTGRHVEPAEWNALLDDPATLVIDARNRYEVEVGTFPRALDPGTTSFREFQAFVERLPAAERERPVAMFCTGGIRCEKASALMLELGFREVNQLKGGILRYLDTMSADDNRWRGECFVFDGRVAVDRDLSEAGYVQCHACRRPLSPADLDSPDYREGVSCPRCIDDLEPERAARLEERRRQVRLARGRGEKHIGAAPAGAGKA